MVPLAKAKFAQLTSAEPNRADLSGEFLTLLQNALLLACKEQQTMAREELQGKEQKL